MKKKNNNTPPSSYRLPKETLEKIARIAKQRGWSKSNVIKCAILNYESAENILRREDRLTEPRFQPYRVEFD